MISLHISLSWTRNWNDKKQGYHDKQNSQKKHIIKAINQWWFKVELRHSFDWECRNISFWVQRGVAGDQVLLKQTGTLVFTCNRLKNDPGAGVNLNGNLTHK
jgi:hypothetical protein